MQLVLLSKIVCHRIYWFEWTCFPSTSGSQTLFARNQIKKGFLKGEQK